MVSKRAEQPDPAYDLSVGDHLVLSGISCRLQKAALGELDLSGRSDPVTQIVAKKIIELAKEGERDPERLRKRAIEALRDVPPGAAAGA